MHPKLNAYILKTTSIKIVSYRLLVILFFYFDNDGIDSTHSTDLDVVVCDNIITARANGYVDFAIETAKELNLFEDEADLQETIAFWREFQRVE